MNIVEIKHLIDQAIQTGQLSQSEWLTIENGIREDGIISKEETELLTQLQFKIMNGGVRLIS